MPAAPNNFCNKSGSSNNKLTGKFWYNYDGAGAPHLALNEAGLHGYSFIANAAWAT